MYTRCLKDQVHSVDAGLVKEQIDADFIVWIGYIGLPEPTAFDPL